jgi:HEAT repeat protein
MIRTLFLVTTLASVTLAAAQQPVPASGDEAVLIGVLQSDAPLFDKAKACQRLAVIGTSKAVGVLSGLLADEQLSHYARTGLEANPSPAVDKAFRDAIPKLSGKPLIGVIDSIGVRRDAESVSLLNELVNQEDERVAGAALSALGQIATPDATEVIQRALDGKQELRVAAADACLATADALLAAGKTQQASRVLTAVRDADLPRHLDVAARFGLIRTGLANPAALLEEYLSAQDEELFQIGLSLANRSPSPQTTKRLVDQLSTLPAGRQALLIRVLGGRGETSALPAVLAAAQSDDESVRSAAIEVLGTLGDVSVLPVLLEAAASENEVLAMAAQDSLSELNDQRVDASIVSALRDSSGPERLALIKVVGRRGLSDAISPLLQLMTDEDDQVSAAAIDALGMTVGARELPTMIDQLLQTDSPQTAAPLKDALGKACTRMADRDAAATMLLDRMAGASTNAKGDLLELMIYVGGQQALAGIGSAAKSNDPALADAATQALGKWLTPDVAPVLLDLAVNGNESFRVRCLRGYIRVIRQFGLKTNERLKMSKTAFAAATRDDERKLVLDTVTRFPSVAGLRFVTPHLGDESLQTDAAKAAIMIGEKIVVQDPHAVAGVIPRIIAATTDPELVQRATVLAERADAAIGES